MDNTELRNTFDHFDRDHNGAIDFDEFCDLLDALNSEMEPASRRIGFDVIDGDGNGTIEFEEFASWWNEQD